MVQKKALWTAASNRQWDLFERFSQRGRARDSSSVISMCHPVRTERKM